MNQHDKLLQKVQSLNKAKKYQEVIDALPDEVLTTHNSADLYAEKAEAFWRSKQKEESKKAAEQALGIQPEHAKGNYYLGAFNRNRKEYGTAIEFYQKAINIDPDFAPPYNGLGIVHHDRKEYDKAIILYQKAIELDPEYPHPYNNLGNVHYIRKEYDTAIKFYQKAISIDPDFTTPYNGLGSIYKIRKKYDKAIELYKKAIEVDPESPYPYFNLGNVHHGRKEYIKAVEFHQKAIEIDPEYASPCYGLGNAYKELKKYKESKEAFEKYVSLEIDESNYFVSKAKEEIAELKKLLSHTESYGNIDKLVEKIKELLHFKKGCITHYTSLSVAKVLITEEKSNFRLSEGAFLNDTSEGRELYKFLDFHYVPVNNHDTAAEQFSRKPFIGSFVNEHKHDDLTLWRMYGKENMIEAQGCAITIDMEKLVELLKASIQSDSTAGSMSSLGSDFNFYQVAYREESKKDFVLPGATKKKTKALNDCMKKLAEEVKIFNEHKKKEPKETRDAVELLNGIAYLFKTAEYQYEHEIRLVLDDTGFEVQFNKPGEAPKAYLDLINIRPLITKLTLGPKVERSDEWAAIFYYSLKKDELFPDIYISRLPFK